MHGLLQNFPVRLKNALSSMHQLPLPLSNTNPLLIEIMFPISFKDFVLKDQYLNENETHRPPWVGTVQHAKFIETVGDYFCL